MNVPDITTVSFWIYIKERLQIHYYRHKFCSHLAIVVEVGLEESTYEIEEGNIELEVCAVITNGTLERNIAVTLVTANGTATRKSAKFI